MRRRGASISRCTAAAAVALGSLALVLGAAGSATDASAAVSATLNGTVVAAGKPLPGAQVTLYVGTRTGAEKLGGTTAGSTGTFAIPYSLPAAGVLYVAATPANADRLRLLSVVGVVGNAGGVAPSTLTKVTVNELTTVATSYALAQFVTGGDISGPSPALENAAATASNLVDPASGGAGGVVTNTNNGARNDTLATLDTLANLVAVCSAAANGPRCDSLLRLATPPGGSTSANTSEAVVNLVKNPVQARAALYALSRSESVYEPTLAAPPEAWILALLYTDTGLYASGRIAIDAKGNVWSNNNWQPGTQTASEVATALNPVGGPIFGSPISGGGIQGAGWGAAIGPDGSVWITNLGGSTITKLSGEGKPLSPDSGWSNGGLVHPQGVAVDQKGNVWIANNYGPKSAPGQGDVVVYPGGDPTKAITITGGGLNHPFAVQIDGQGDAWVTNAGLGGAKLVNTRAAIAIGKFGGSVTVISPDFKATSYSPIESDSFKWPLGLALDSKGNAWTVSYFGRSVTEIHPGGSIADTFKLPARVLPWSEAIDGSDRVWVAQFGLPGVSLLCGENTAACPPGSSTGDILSPKLGFRSRAIQHLTSVQLDQSGNVWLSNNWAKIKPATGGIGVVELIGMATPVCTPLTPLPVRPSTATADACPSHEAAATSTESDGSSNTWVWAAVGLVVAVAIGVALILRRRRQ